MATARNSTSYRLPDGLILNIDINEELVTFRAHTAMFLLAEVPEKEPFVSLEKIRRYVVL
jgi:hypothetical protein